VITYFAGLATGLLVSGVSAYLLWPLYIASIRRRGETWAQAQKRELSRLDRLAELDEIPDTQRSYANDRSVN
jgi:hypothetical protein